MARLLPFRGLRYTAAAGDLSDLLAPPYDVISPAEQRALATRNEHNAVHLELAEGGEERYANVAELVRQWEASGALARDDTPMLYVYEQRFSEGGQEYIRRALIAEVEAQPWEEGAVKAHEHTMSGPKEDRLKLLEATGIQFSPVFMVARDRAGQLRQFIETTIAERPADLEAHTPDDDHHRLWLIEAGRYEMRRLAPLLSESFYIADGHHRYETQVAYKRLMLERHPDLPDPHPSRFAMAAIVAADDPGLVIRPIHRILARPAPDDWRERLGEWFEILDIGPAGDVPAAERVLAQSRDAILALNLDPGRATSLMARDAGVFERLAPPGHGEEWASIPPNLLRYGVLAPLWEIGDEELRAGVVEYTHEATEVAARATGDTCGFLLNPVGIDSVISLADRGERMPQKSTFFHPKLGTGLVFHVVSGDG